MKTIEIFGQGEESLSPSLTSQRRVNCFYELRTDTDPAKITILGTPGLTNVLTLPNNFRVRAWAVVQNITYLISGNTLYSVDFNLGIGSLTPLGTVQGGQTADASIINNGIQLLIADSRNLYVYTLTDNSTFTWTDSGLVPTFIQNNEFSVPNDQRSIFYSGQSLQVIEDEGHIQTTVISAALTNVTTTANTASVSGHVQTETIILTESIPDIGDITTIETDTINTGNVMTVTTTTTVGSNPPTITTSTTPIVPSVVITTLIGVVGPNTVTDTIITTTIGTLDSGLSQVNLGTAVPKGTLLKVNQDSLAVALAARSTQISYIDGFFLLSVNGTQQWMKSASYDGTTWPVLDFASKQSQPDLLSSIDVLNSTIILWGTNTIEFWQNVGTFPWPFQRINGATLNWGLAALKSKVFINNSMIFLGINEQNDVEVIMLNGTTPQVIDNFDMSRLFNSFDSYSDATAIAYTTAGHMMYEITFPNANRTFLYDISTSVWTEVQSGVNSIPQRHTSVYGISVGNNTYVSDYNGTIYLLDPANFTEDDNPIYRMVTSRHIRMEGNQVGVAELYVYMNTGNGTQIPPGNDPQLTLEISTDQGRTYPVVRTASMGKAGQYITPRVIFRRIGLQRDYVFRFSTSDPVPFEIYSVSAVLVMSTDSKR